MLGLVERRGIEKLRGKEEKETRGKGEIEEDKVIRRIPYSTHCTGQKSAVLCRRYMHMKIEICLLYSIYSTYNMQWIDSTAKGT